MAQKQGGIDRVRTALEARGASAEIVQFDKSTRTAQDAAAAIGCTVEAIAKSLVFRTETSNLPVLAIVSGSNRADEAALARLIAGQIDGEDLGRADPDFVRSETGFAIGGVPPIGHANPIVTAIDQDLTELERIWAAAGAPNAVFALSPADLVRWTDGIVGSFAQR